ncbi:MAG: hypothetical protein R3A51_21870 [Nannocystaceae bacterium]
MSRPVIALRRATSDDLEDVVAIKEALSMPVDAATTGGGGFILGVSREAYAAAIAAGCVTLLALDAQTVGYARALPDPQQRAAEVWRRREAIAWDGLAPRDLEERAIAYFDQLAVLPGPHRRGPGAALALRVLAELFAGGHEHVLTTTLRAPVRNTAAYAYLRRIGARRVGALDERYPGVGAVVSDIHHLDRPTFERHVLSFRDRYPTATRLGAIVAAGLGG